MNYKELVNHTELELWKAMFNYLKALKSEMHSNSVKRGIKSAKEQKARENRSEV